MFVSKCIEISLLRENGLLLQTLLRPSDGQSITGYLLSYYWYTLLGQEKQVGLSALLEDTEKQNVMCG
jgi:hypothetical protein